jgi:hypothetical protein
MPRSRSSDSIVEQYRPEADQGALPDSPRSCGRQPLPLDLSVLDPPGVNKGVARFGKTDF